MVHLKRAALQRKVIKICRNLYPQVLVIKQDV